MPPRLKTDLTALASDGLSAVFCLLRGAVWVTSCGAAPQDVELVAQRCERRKVEAIDAASAGGLLTDQAGMLEDQQVLRHSGAGDRQLCRDLHHRQRPIGQAAHYRPPVAVPQCIPAVRHLVRIHKTLESANEEEVSRATRDERWN